MQLRARCATACDVSHRDTDNGSLLSQKSNANHGVHAINIVARRVGGAWPEKVCCPVRADYASLGFGKPAEGRRQEFKRSAGVSPAFFC